MRKEIAVTWLSIALTLLALGFVYRHLASAGPGAGGEAVSAPLEAWALAVLVTALVYGSLVYLITRLGYLRRHRGPMPALEPLEDRHLGRSDLPRLCILIPSYKEELRVLRQTIFSAALSVYGARRIVVLIDDPRTADPSDLSALQSSLAFVARVHREFHAVATRMRARYSEFILRNQRTSMPPCEVNEVHGVAALYEFLANFVERLGQMEAPGTPDKADEFLLRHIVGPCADRHRARARALRESPGSHDLEQEYRRLIAHASIEISSFERKRYRNLSHAPNKAMNLNSYIGLMGRSFRIARADDQPMLEECASSRADLIVADASYLLTLDADSMVLPDYLLKLVDIMERDETVAVAQTPYSALPGEASALERAAGAQTDLQYVVHQGSSASNAAYWVGANALLRVSALRSIKTKMLERGHALPVYIQDRTVIEDTGSTIDLIRGGWKLHNHPERLAYSATPPDFGSLIIQRRRWSNGGLIILPDLVRYALERDRNRASLCELFLRAHYLCGPALTGFSLLLLLLLPFDGALLSPWLAATVVPYYALYARDARRLAYSWRELLDVYTLNLMLLPVTLAGVLRSIQQALTGRKPSFGRTPKTEQRTSIQPVHVLLQLGLLAIVGSVAWRNLSIGQFYFAAFWTLNAGVLIAGFSTLIGVRNAWQDICAQAPWRRSATAPIAKQASPGTSLREPVPPVVRVAANEESPGRHSARKAGRRP